MVPVRVNRCVNEARVRLLRELRKGDPQLTCLLNARKAGNKVDPSEIQARLAQPENEVKILETVVSMIQTLRDEGWSDEQIEEGLAQPNPTR